MATIIVALQSATTTTTMTGSIIVTAYLETVSGSGSSLPNNTSSLPYNTYGPDYYSYGDDCWWLLRQARITGSPYWWSRYNACVGYY